MTEPVTTAAAPMGAEAREAEGRRAVREVLVARLEGAGMARRKGVTEAEHRDWLARLVDRLAYMTRANLSVLADHLLVMGEGKLRHEWPREVTILGWAEGLQPRPIEEAPIVQSWLRSVEGPVAVAGGFEVELLRFLRKARRPPLAYHLDKIRQEAADNARWFTMAQERIGTTVERQGDRAFCEAYRRDRDFARGLVAAGVDHRAAKEAAA